jgi:conjugative coupling factor TraD (TOL family)
VIVFDPKGDADLFMRMYVEAREAGRLDNFYFFHLGHPEISARYNPVGTFSRITEVATRIANQLPGEGQSAAFREFVWRYVNVIAKALTALGRKSDYGMILEYGQDIEPLVRDYLTMLAKNADASGKWEQHVVAIKDAFEDSDNKEYRVSKEMASRDRYVVALLRYCKDKNILDGVARSLARTFEYDRGYFDKLVSSLLPLMEKLTTGKSAELLSPDYLNPNDTRPIFTWSEVIRTKGIVYVGLDALTDPEVSGAVGNAMFSDLTSYAGYIYKHGAYNGLPEMNIKRAAVNIHADEFNELIGDEFIPMLNKAGGAGFQVTAYTQTWSDVEARLQDKAKAGQVAGNFNTLIMLRVREQATAEMLTKQFEKTEINHLMLVSGSTDSSNPHDDVHFTSNTQQRITTQQVELIHPNHLMSLPKGQCFALLDGGKPYKLRLPLSDKADFDGVPESLTAIAEDMRKRYSSNDDWYQFTPSWKDTKAAV